MADAPSVFACVLRDSEAGDLRWPTCALQARRTADSGIDAPVQFFCAHAFVIPQFSHVVKYPAKAWDKATVHAEPRAPASITEIGIGIDINRFRSSADSVEKARDEGSK